jgi:hypothetical protein
MSDTKHAQKRSQQRCIPPIVHSWLDVYGAQRFDGRGGCTIYFDKRSRKRMEAELGRHFVSENKKYLNMYRVEGSDSSEALTYGHRYKRVLK